MNIKRKYAIRKLAVGVASVSIGLFVSNVVDSSLTQSFKMSEVAKAADETYNFSTIYINDKANEEVDENGTNNNAVSKIEISDTPYHERIKRLRFTLKDDVDVSKGIVFRMVEEWYPFFSELGDIVQNSTSSNLYLNDEKIGEIEDDISSKSKMLNPESFTSFDDFYKKLTSLEDKDSSNFYVNKKITFNKNFDKYNKNRVFEFNIFLSENNKVYINYDPGKNPDLDKIEKLKKIKKEFNHNIYFNKKEIYKTDMKYDFKLSVDPYYKSSTTVDDTITDSKYTYDENSNVSFTYLSIIDRIENPPAKIEALWYSYKTLTKENIGRKTPTKTNKAFLKKGTTFKFNINPKIFEIKNTQQNNEIVEVSYKESLIGERKENILYYWQNEAFLTTLPDDPDDFENFEKTKKVKLKYKKLSDSEISYELMDDLLISSPNYSPSIMYGDNFFQNLRLKQDFINNVDLSKYKKIFTTTNSEELKQLMGEIFPPISITIQEPGKQALIGETALENYSFIKNTSTGEIGKGTVKIKYLNENKKEIKKEDTIVEDKEWNSVFEITPQKIEGYEFLESSSPLKDIVGDGIRTVTLTYKTIEKNRITPFNTIYKEDSTKEKGIQEVETEGENGIEAYSEVDSDYSRVIKEKIDRIVKVGTKPTVKVEKIPSPVKYVNDNTREKGQENITVKGKDGSKTTTTTYTVNPNTGEVTSHEQEPVVVQPTETIVKVATKDKVETRTLHYGVNYERDDKVAANTPNVIKQEGKDGIKRITTSYTAVESGEMPKHVLIETILEPKTRIEVVGTKPEDIVTTEKFKRTYIGDETKDKGVTEIVTPGVDGKTVVKRTYSLPDNVPVREEQEAVDNVSIAYNYEFNVAIPHDSEPIVTKSVNEVVKVGTKPKVVYSKDGNNIVKTTTRYTVNPDTGEITENTTKETLKENGAKDKVEVEKLTSPVRYEKDSSREKGQENITVKGKDGSKTITTTYTVNDKTGELVPNVGNPVVVESTETVVKVAAKDKVVYSKDGNNVIKETTTYNVNSKTGKITENITKETFKENGAKDKVEVEKLPSPVRYEKDTTREKGQENITIKGKDGSKTTTTTYTVNPNTGEVVPNVGKPVVVEPTETVVKVAAKDKIEVVNKKDGETIKIITNYEVNPKTGEIKEVKKEELLSKKGIPEVSEEAKEFKGGVNPTESIVREALPELKVALIKDGEGNVLEVIKEDEEPKEIKGYKNTGKTEVDKDGYKVYVYEKEEPKVDKNTPQDKEDNKGAIKKKEELPKTSASMLSTVGLLSIFGLRKNRKKDKR